MTVADLPLWRATARRADPDTSRDAAATLRSLTARHAAAWHVLRAIGPNPAHVVEARYDAYQHEPWWTPQTPASLRSRLAMLQRHGLVVETGRKLPSPNGGHGCRELAAVDPERAARLFDRKEGEG